MPSFTATSAIKLPSSKRANPYTAEQATFLSMPRHFVYKTAWKKLEPFWDLVIRLNRVSAFTSLLETVLSGESWSDTGFIKQPIATTAVRSTRWSEG
jgi:hypothetical protein